MFFRKAGMMTKIKVRKRSKITEIGDTSHSYQIMAVDSLTPSPHNAKTHPTKQVEMIADSIKRFGHINPIIINTERMIIAGHGRWLAAQRLGLKNIGVLMVDNLTSDEMRAYMLADNKIAEHARWDQRLLAIELNHLVQADLRCEVNFSAEITGFSSAEIDSLTTHSNDDAEDQNLMEAMSADYIPTSKPDDIWQLGNHLIVCGNALDKQVYKKLLNGKTTHLVCTDPPYNVKIEGFASTRHEDFSMAAGEMSSPEFTDFLYHALKHSTADLKDGGCVYAFMDWRHDRELQEAARRCQLKQLNLCVWDKGVGGMGSLYRSQHELIFVYKKGDESHQNNVMLGQHGRNRTNVWKHPSANTSKEGRQMLEHHPTPKPVSMIADIIKDVTKPGQIIIDPFLGSGSALLAAEKTNRKCRGIELSPAYVDVCIRRWQEYTGQDAIHTGTGLSFSKTEKAQKSKGKVHA